MPDIFQSQETQLSASVEMYRNQYCRLILSRRKKIFPFIGMFLSLYLESPFSWGSRVCVDGSFPYLLPFPGALVMSCFTTFSQNENKQTNNKTFVFVIFPHRETCCLVVLVVFTLCPRKGEKTSLTSKVDCSKGPLSNKVRGFFHLFDSHYRALCLSHFSYLTWQSTPKK